MLSHLQYRVSPVLKMASSSSKGSAVSLSHTHRYGNIDKDLAADGWNTSKWSKLIVLNPISYLPFFYLHVYFLDQRKLNADC